MLTLPVLQAWHCQENVTISLLPNHPWPSLHTLMEYGNSFYVHAYIILKLISIFTLALGVYDKLLTFL